MVLKNNKDWLSLIKGFENSKMTVKNIVNIKIYNLNSTTRKR